VPAWRLCRAPFADLSGEGARLYGGRWNSPGRPMVYMASSPALALLEVRVHLALPLDMLPSDYVLMAIELRGLAVEQVASLPADPLAFGDEWLRQGRSPVLQVPSVIVPYDTNFLLNPAHPAAEGASIVSTVPFAFGPRLFP
jgi:RES domain-containing protein